LGTGLHLAADGYLLGDDPCFPAHLPPHGYGRFHLTVGIIEGIAEATAAIVKIFSGALSDRLGKRKMLAALGYGLAAITKPVFPLAPAIG
jgi:nitrate/nitrite transporter NarK